MFSFFADRAAAKIERKEAAGEAIRQYCRTASPTVRNMIVAELRSGKSAEKVLKQIEAAHRIAGR